MFVSAYLADSKIGDRGIREIIKGLQINKSIRTIELSKINIYNCKMTSKGFEELVNFLNSFQTLIQKIGLLNLKKANTIFQFISTNGLQRLLGDDLTRVDKLLNIIELNEKDSQLLNEGINKIRHIE